MAHRWEHREYRDDRERHERPMTERAGDEVRSWFGDEEAARRRRMDEIRDDRYDRDPDRVQRAAERGWDRTREQVRNWTDRDRDGRTGLSEFADNDRASYYSGYSTYNAPQRGDYWTRERSFGDTRRYTNEDRYDTAWNTRPSTTSERTWQGPDYSGRGPRGYQRTDERIREEICDRLTDDPRIDASDIEVNVKGGELTLNGSVRTREEKRFAEDLVERISGVRDVNNHLRVRPSTEVLGTARSGASSVLGLTDTPPPQGQTRNH
jgi:osmotically-inducible protein OsmY